MEGIAGEYHIRHFPLATGVEGDHFVGINEMVGNRVLRCFARYFSAVDNLQEIPPIGVAKQVLKVAHKLELNAILGLLGVGFEVIC